MGLALPPTRWRRGGQKRDKTVRWLEGIPEWLGHSGIRWPNVHEGSRNGSDILGSGGPMARKGTPGSFQRTPGSFKRTPGSF